MSEVTDQVKGAAEPDFYDDAVARCVATMASEWVRIRIDRGDHPHDAMMDAATMYEAYLAIEVTGS